MVKIRTDWERNGINRVWAYTEYTEDQPPQSVRYCFAHSSKDLVNGKCTWCELTITQIVAKELKAGKK